MPARLAAAVLAGLFATGLGLALGFVQPLYGPLVGMFAGAMIAGATLRSGWQIVFMAATAIACPVAVLAALCPFDSSQSPAVDAFNAAGLALFLFALAAAVVIPLGGALGLLLGRRVGRASRRDLLLVRVGAVAALIGWLVTAGGIVASSCA